MFTSLFLKVNEAIMPVNMFLQNIVFTNITFLFVNSTSSLGYSLMKTINNNLTIFC